MVWFEPDFLPGYAWSFPLGAGRANVGFGIRRGGSYDVGSMKHLWPDILARPHIAAFLGTDAEAGGAAQGLAHPGAHRRRRAERGSRVVRWRRGGRDGSDDG